LVFSNCRTYNKPETLVVQAANSIESLFDDKVQKFLKEINPNETSERKPKRQKPDLNLEESRPKRVKHTPPPKDIPASDTPQRALKKAKLDEKLKFCSSILKELTNKKNLAYSWPFLAPVDVVALGLRDYLDVIKEPMDLGSVKQKLDSGVYRKPEEFAHDIRLIFKNCVKYNSPDHEISKLAFALEKIFESKYAEVPSFPTSDSDSGEESDESDSSEDEKDKKQKKSKEKTPKKERRDEKKKGEEKKEEKVVKEEKNVKEEKKGDKSGKKEKRPKEEEDTKSYPIIEQLRKELQDVTHKLTDLMGEVRIIIKIK